MWFACASSAVSGPIMTSRTVCRASVRLAGFKSRLLSNTRLLLRYVANLMRTGLVLFASGLPRRCILSISEMSIEGVMPITWFNVTSSHHVVVGFLGQPERRTEFRRECCSSSSCWSSMASTFFCKVSIWASLLASSERNACTSCCNPATVRTPP